MMDFLVSRFSPCVNLYRPLMEVAMTAWIRGQGRVKGQALPADMKAHLSTPCSSSLSFGSQTICILAIWGRSKSNKSHVLITFEEVMTSGPSADPHLVQSPDRKRAVLSWLVPVQLLRYLHHNNSVLECPSELQTKPPYTGVLYEEECFSIFSPSVVMSNKWTEESFEGWWHCSWQVTPQLTLNLQY